MGRFHFEWTDEAVTELRRMKAAGKSFSEISTALGAPSRNACIGKAHRLGLIVTKPARPGRKPQSESTRLPREPKPRLAKPPKVVAIKPTPPPPPLPVDRKGVPFLDGRPGQCRWPLWNLNTHFDAKEICGEPAMPGRSYCPACNAISVAPKAPREPVKEAA